MRLFPKRRWLRFSIRTLLVAVTIFCVWLGWQVSIVRQRRELVMELTDSGGSVDPMDGPAFEWEEYIVDGENKNRHIPTAFRRWIGDRPYASINLPTPGVEQHSRKEMKERMRSIGRRYQDAFPEAFVNWCQAADCLVFEDLDQSCDFWYDNLRAPRDRSQIYIGAPDIAQ